MKEGNKDLAICAISIIFLLLVAYGIYLSKDLIWEWIMINFMDAYAVNFDSIIKTIL